MIRYECDKCGRKLGANDAARFIVKVEVYAAGGPLELDAADLGDDAEDQLASIVKQLNAADPDEIEDQTYRCLRFDLCADCQRMFLRAPLR